MVFSADHVLAVPLLYSRISGLSPIPLAPPNRCCPYIKTSLGEPSNHRTEIPPQLITTDDRSPCQTTPQRKLATQITVRANIISQIDRLSAVNRTHKEDAAHLSTPLPKNLLLSNNILSIPGDLIISPLSPLILAGPSLQSSPTQPPVPQPLTKNPRAKRNSEQD